jgi:hypothetical protein
MSQQGLLPKFGPREKARGDARPPKGGARLDAARRDASPYPPDDAGKNLGEGKGDRTDAGCSLKSESTREPKGLAGWWQRVWRRSSRRHTREAVQAEFSLDLVKVVRNDLSDADATAAARQRGKGKLKIEHQPVEESVFSVPVR